MMTMCFFMGTISLPKEATDEGNILFLQLLRSWLLEIGGKKRKHIVLPVREDIAKIG